eukprot:CAMPEP_0113876112 /NCGR_PEP_ID=MMETSP0780_2-20120614/5307_1 /TAXON_ID=652834 /ORGANISM="Palpitomonas bilix" /LENGTH=629 /DNA_ID=CAMNT_0000862157 /DNA_START=210 /DNA_END=2097 /DNA_ORIENTATION=- /assembly_acc=CAM_ASM_000599
MGFQQRNLFHSDMSIVFSAQERVHFFFSFTTDTRDSSLNLTTKGSPDLPSVLCVRYVEEPKGGHPNTHKRERRTLSNKEEGSNKEENPLLSKPKQILSSSKETRRDETMFFASPQQTEALPPSLFSNGTLPSDKILLPNPSDWNSTTSSSSHLLVDTNDSRRWFLFSALEERQRSTPTFVLPRRVFLDETLGKGAYARICRTDVASVLAKVFVLSPHKPDAHTVLKDAFVECGMLHHLAETARLCDLPFSHRHIMEPLACWQVHGTRDRPVTCSVSKLAPSSSSRAVDPEVLTPVCVIFVPNGSFSAKELFANQGPVRSLVTPEQRRKLILQLPTQLMEAYRVCNAGNVVHMDIKPENIIFYKDAEHADGYVSRLIDPGIACLERTSTVRASLPYPYHPPEAWEEIDPAQKPSALDGFQVYPYPNELFDLWMIGCTTAMGLAALYLPDEHEEAAGDKSKHHTYQGKKTCSFDDLLRIIQRSRSSDSTPWTVFQSFWKERSTGHEKAYPASSVAAQTQQLEEYVTCIRNHLQRWKEDSGGKEKEKEKEERRTLSRDAERVLWTTFSSPLTRSRLFLLLNNGSDNLQKRFEENPCALPFCAPGSRSSEELNRMMAERQSPSFSFPPHGRPW